MNRKILVSAVAICALGTAGIAFAEGTEHKKPDQSAQQGQQQGTQTDTPAGMEATDTGSQTQAGVQPEAQRRGVARLDAVNLKSLDEDQAKSLQTKLQELGYYNGEIDGKIGPKSKGALSQYFRDQAQLVAQGKLSELAMTSLGFDDSEIQQVRGVDEQGEAERTPTKGFDDAGEQGTESSPQEVPPKSDIDMDQP